MAYTTIDKHTLHFNQKNYTGTGEHMCAKDGWVVFHNSELLAGNLAKKTLGDGSKTGLVYMLVRDHGKREAASMLNR